MKFCFETLGCKVNLCETQALAQLAQERGHTLVKEDADAVVLNTCAVTAVSEHKCLRALHRLRRENPRAVVAVCGCFSRHDPERLAATGEADLLFGTSDRAAVIPACEEAAAGRSHPHPPLRPGGACQAGIPPRGEPFELLHAGVPAGRTRALLKIQDGCDNYCTYCIIPYLRGHVRSMPPEAARDEARRLAESGVREIVVTGIEIASYGRDLTGGPSLPVLMEALLRENPSVRFRLGSLEPRIVDEDFCARLRPFGNLAPHFHLSLQSGCDSVLRRMGRRYGTASFLQNAERLREAFPDCSLTTDLIVGFPGETEEEFAQTLQFLEDCAFAAVHVFPYSAREGTAAARLPEQLPAERKQARAARAKALAASLGERYRERFLGRTVSVLLEHPADGGLWSGHTPYAFPVFIPAPRESPLKNTLHEVRLTALHGSGLLGEPLPPLNP